MVVGQLNIQHLLLKCQAGRNGILMLDKIALEAPTAEEVALVEEEFKVVGIRVEVLGILSKSLIGEGEAEAIEIRLQQLPKYKISD